MITDGPARVIGSAPEAAVTIPVAVFSVALLTRSAALRSAIRAALGAVPHCCEFLLVKLAIVIRVKALQHPVLGPAGQFILRQSPIAILVEARDHPVGALLHPPVRLEAWPGGQRETRIVIIGDGLDEAYVRKIFDAFLGRAAVDTPDRAALEDNPLAIPGVRL